jgi:uncharacterized protein YndB with AHSA1/START domain
MTTQRTFKRRVRERMDKTGESYTAARRILISHGDRPDEPVFEPPLSDDALAAATGHGWQHWLARIDEWDGTRLTHTEIARRLVSELDVAGWWAQSITLGYERARGMRAPGQHADGFSVSASKTVGVPVERLWAAWGDEALCERWLPGADLRVRTATAPRSARYDWEDGSTRVHVTFASRGEDKSTVTVSHERLPDADTADEMKAWWRERLAALKPLLEAS